MEPFPDLDLESFSLEEASPFDHVALSMEMPQTQMIDDTPSQGLTDIPMRYDSLPQSCNPFIVVKSMMDGPIEEETNLDYGIDSYYPIKIGDFLQSRKYVVVAKLGFGSKSTVWLVRNLQNHCYSTLKIYASGHQTKADHEIKVLNHLESTISEHEGSRDLAFQVLRTKIDDFTLVGRTGLHKCLVHKTLGLTTRELQDCSDELNLATIREIMFYLLLALDFLHRKAGVIHGNVCMDNIREDVNDRSGRAFEDFALRFPTGRKICPKTLNTIYTSSVVCSRELGPYVLYKYGEAKIGLEDSVMESTFDLYRSPEAVLGLPRIDKFDIWHAGLVAFELVQGKPLIPNVPKCSSKSSFKINAFAHMIELLGSPPQTLMFEEEAQKFVKDEKCSIVTFFSNVDDLDSSVTKIKVESDKVLFINLLKRMLKWRPQDRASAYQLVQDPFFHEVFRMNCVDGLELGNSEATEVIGESLLCPIYKKYRAGEELDSSVTTKDVPDGMVVPLLIPFLKNIGMKKEGAEIDKKTRSDDKGFMGSDGEEKEQPESTKSELVDSESTKAEEARPQQTDSEPKYREMKPEDSETEEMSSEKSIKDEDNANGSTENVSDETEDGNNKTELHGNYKEKESEQAIVASDTSKNEDTGSAEGSGNVDSVDGEDETNKNEGTESAEISEYVDAGEPGSETKKKEVAESVQISGNADAGDGGDQTNIEEKPKLPERPASYVQTTPVGMPNHFGHSYYVFKGGRGYD